ncbi:MAG: protein kinase [Verrucomicrobiales bacterium]|nr:protein kinase [Verrucomicrobiales bacterium]
MNLPEIEGYQFDELIGEGGCGFVYRCSSTTGGQCVVNVLKALAINPALVRENLDRLSRAPGHPGLVDLYGYDLVNNPYYQITSLHGHQEPETERWSGDDITTLIGRLDEEQASGLVDQLVEALAFEHQYGVIHVGLKPSNVFLSGHANTGYQIRLSDWGQGYMAGLHYLEMGDMGFYASPEQLSVGDFTNGRGQQWDVYSFGVVAYQLITGHLPRLDALLQEFLSDHDLRKGSQMSSLATILQQPEQYVEWMQKQPDITWPQAASTDALEQRRLIIERCLSLDATERYSDMREVLSAFQTLENSAALRQMQGSYVVAEQAMKQRIGKSRTAAAVATIMAVSGFIGTAVFYGKYTDSQASLKESLSHSDEGVKVNRSEMEKVQTELGAALKDKDAEVADAKKETQRIQKKAEEVEDFLLSLQSYGDHFFEMILEHRDTDVPGFQLQRNLRLVEAKSYYEQKVKRYSDDPDLMVPISDAYRFLGEIYHEQKDFSLAQNAFAEAEKRLLVLQKQKPDDAGIVKNLAAVKFRQAEELYALGGDEKKAIAMLQESSTLWQQWGIKDSRQALQAELKVAENLLQAAQWYRLKRDNKLAGENFEAAADALVALQEKNPQNAEIVASLAASFMGIGEILLESGQQESGVEMYKKSVELLSEAVSLNGAVDEYQYHLASALVLLGSLERKAESLQDAMGLLSRLMPSHSDDTRYATTLADCLGALAELQRDAGQSVAGIKLEKDAVKLLEQVISQAAEGKKVDTSVRISLAKRNCHMAELYGDVGQFAESQPALTRAIQLISELLEEDESNVIYQRLYAYAGGLAAFAREKTGDKKGAIALYAAALKQWEKVSAAHPKDAQATEGVNWTKRQLQGLKK